jgi:type IV conjugative transfer system coupling protein TraD
MWRECPTLPSLESVSTTLIPMGASEDPFWQGSARTIFSEAAHRMRKDRELSYNKFLRTLLAIKLDKLREFLAGTPAATLVDGKIEKTAISIRSVLTNYVKAMRYLQGIDRSGKPKFTIREWMQGTKVGAKNPWLFITSNQQHHESLKPVISMWLSIAADSLLSMGENRHRRVWFFYDELKSLHKLPVLPEVIAEGRKFGGCFALGFQSFPQIEELYGTKAAEAMFDLLNTKYFFRSPSAAVSKFVAEDIGETVRKKFSEQTSFGNESVRDGISFGKEEERVNIVSHTDVQKLEDLECFVTLPGDYPVVKMALK